MSVVNLSCSNDSHRHYSSRSLARDPEWPEVRANRAVRQREPGGAIAHDRPVDDSSALQRNEGRWSFAADRH